MWQSSLISKPKLRTYRKFKSQYDTENYVKFNYHKYQRSLTAELHMGILPLAIETGRYTNIPINQRFCFYCQDKVEDEFHFVFQCKLYENERHYLYSVLKLKIENFDTLSDEDKFTEIMSSDSRNFYQYIEESWEIRKGNFFETLNE